MKAITYTKLSTTIIHYLVGYTLLFSLAWMVTRDLVRATFNLGGVSIVFAFILPFQIHYPLQTWKTKVLLILLTLVFPIVLAIGGRLLTTR